MIGVIGLGNMAQAIIGGILKQHLAGEGSIIGYDKSPAAMSRVSEMYGIATGDSNKDVVGRADVVILAVKPQVIGDVIEEIAPSASSDTIFISIAPGKSISWITEKFGKKIKLVRCMPNTPALVGEGMTGYCVNENITEEDKETAKKILESFGRAEEVNEGLLAAVTSVSGSSPAYVFMLIEAMADQAVADGMARPQAYEFAAQAVLGSAKMVLETGKHPGELKDMVCSPAGTTIQAVRILEKNGFRAAVEEAMAACTEKAQKM